MTWRYSNLPENSLYYGVTARQFVIYISSPATPQGMVSPTESDQKKAGAPVHFLDDTESLWAEVGHGPPWKSATTRTGGVDGRDVLLIHVWPKHSMYGVQAPHLVNLNHGRQPLARIN